MPRVAEQTFSGETEIWMRELDLDRGALVGPETVIWTRTQLRAVWAEAPHLYHREGWFYLVTAEGGTAFEHSVMVARSRELAGPYEPCPRNPVLTHRHLGHGAEVQNVGHADLVEGPHGQWWMLLLASRPVDGHHILGRETHLARVAWEDDWPVINPGAGMLDRPTERSGNWGSEGVPQISDFLSVRGFATFAESASTGLVLRSTGHPIGSTGPSAAVLRRLTSTESAVTVTLDRLEDEATAGLVLRQSSDAQMRIELVTTADGLRADLVTRSGRDATLASVALPSGPVLLRADVASGEVAWTATPEGGAPVELGRTPISALSTETAGGFVGTTFGPFVDGPAGAGVLFTSWTQDDRR